MTSAVPSPVFQKVPANPSFPRIEESIIALWRDLDAFRASNRRRKEAGAKEFVFYDGPPFATGTPHYGHLLAGTIKDIVPRFWNMRGYHVDRRFGWDCHGLPIENLAQKELGWSGALEIREKGVAQFNEQCRSMVQTYVGEWRKTVERMGRWVDFDDDYKTMDKDFMESVWWVFKELWNKGRIYKAHRIMPYSWKLTTPLSNFEAGNNYKDVQDPAVTVRFRVRPGQSFFSSHPGSAADEVSAAEIHAGTHDGGGLDLAEHPADREILTFGERSIFILAWTTTPWTLPENLALCVGPAITYVWVEDAKTTDVYLIAKDRLAAVYPKPEQYRVLAEVTGADVAGLTYEPLFPYFAEQPNTFRVLADDFVTTGDGTGIVHLAPAYGEDDYRVCRTAGIALVDPLDEEAAFTGQMAADFGASPGAKLFCKDADKAIIRRLKDEGKLVHQATIVHSYPFCERTDTPLIYRAMEAWYVRVADLRPRMVELNTKIRWVPESVGANRFGNFIADGPDWNISRNRFWGSCLPIWVNEAERTDTICFGSVAELEQAAGLAPGSITDLHKHHLDAVVVRRDGKTYRRTPEVLDCWFESGAMPYAQHHYPFANKAHVEANFPANFIAEGLDQTRGWFYSLLVLSAALFDKPAFQNVVVNGLILAEDGQKMSKSKKNYPDPNLILDSVGADALRAYLIDSPVVRAEPLRFSESGLKEIVRTVVLPYWNALAFFTTYAAVDAYDPRSWTARPLAQRHVMDRWLLSVMQSLIRDVNAEMEAYRLSNVVPRLVAFIDDLTNWYIRLNRRRFWKSEDRQDQADAYATLYEALTTFAKVLAPFMPFLTEEVHQRLVRPVDAAAPASVHWCDYPQVQAACIDADLERRMTVVRSVVARGRELREKQKIKIRQPVASVTIVCKDADVEAVVRTPALAGLVRDELNARDLHWSPLEVNFCTFKVKPNFATLRAKAPAKIKDIGAAAAGWGVAEITTLESGSAITVAGVDVVQADVLIERQPKPGQAIASDGRISVVLDTTMTPELKAEGDANEFKSILQQARKDAGLDVSDRIRVRWAADGALGEAITAHHAMIADEVLAVGIDRDPALTGTSADCNGQAIRYQIEKAVTPTPG